MASIDVRPGTRFGMSTLAPVYEPSGFREKLGFSDQQVQELCTLVRELLDDLLATMPADMRSQVEQRLQPLPLYAHSAPGRFVATSRNINFLATGVSGRGGMACRPAQIPPSSVDGLLVGATPAKVQARDPSLVSAVYHELVHGAVWDAVFTDVALNEAVALRFQREKHPYPGFYATTQPWDDARFTGTTGFGTSDMATWARSKNSTTAWYIATSHALNAVPSDAIWNIMSGLSRYARTPRQTVRGMECVVPMQSDIRAAFAAELGQPLANAVFQTVGLKPMVAGAHVLRFPRTDGQVTEIPFTLHPNPAYRELDAQSQWNGTQYGASDPA